MAANPLTETYQTVHARIAAQPGLIKTNGVGLIQPADFPDWSLPKQKMEFGDSGSQTPSLRLFTAGIRWLPGNSKALGIEQRLVLATDSNLTAIAQINDIQLLCVLALESLPDRLGLPYVADVRFTDGSTDRGGNRYIREKRVWSAFSGLTVTSFIARSFTLG